MRFPKYHLATSVVNRILDLADQEMMLSQSIDGAPNIPNAQAQGGVLDLQLQTPQPAIPAPDGSEEAIAIESQAGGTAADAVGNLAALDALA